jgi:hypothetical protein
MAAGGGPAGMHLTRLMEFPEVADVLGEIFVLLGGVEAVSDKRIQAPCRHGCAAWVRPVEVGSWCSGEAQDVVNGHDTGHEPRQGSHPGHRPHATKRHIANKTRLPTAVAGSPRPR